MQVSHILLVISNTMTTCRETNATIHIYCHFPMPGSYIIVHFVSDALNFSIFDHDTFVCEFLVMKPSTSLTHRHKKKTFLLKTANVISKIFKHLKVIVALSHLLKHINKNNKKKKLKTKYKKQKESQVYDCFFFFFNFF